MKCSNPDCNRGIGLVAYRRGWFSKRRYCSKRCRNALVADAPKLQQKRNVTTYFEMAFRTAGFECTAEAGARRHRARGKPRQSFRFEDNDESAECLVRCARVDRPVNRWC
jgi:hypothetical protein